MTDEQPTTDAAAALTDDELVREIGRRLHARLMDSQGDAPEVLGLRIVEVVSGYVSGLERAGEDAPLISRPIQPDYS